MRMNSKLLHHPSTISHQPSSINPQPSTIKKKQALRLAVFFVDPAGVEPASKQGISELSTCLFCDKFSMRARPQSTKHLTYLVFFSLWLQDSPSTISLWWSLIAKNQERGHLARLTRRATCGGMKRNHDRWLGSECVRIVVISDLGPDIKELNLKTLCMLTQLFISLSNPRVGPILEVQSYDIRRTISNSNIPPSLFLQYNPC